MEKHDDFKQALENRLKRNTFIKKLAIGLLCMAILFFISSLGYAWFIGVKNTNSYTPDSDQETALKLQEQGLVDSDGDGLFDWQEELYGTSKKLRDSDGDGVSDGDEIARGYDPNYFGEGLAEESVEPQQELFEEFVYQVPEQIIIKSSTQLVTPPSPTTQVDQSKLRDALNIMGLAVRDSYVTQPGYEEVFNKLFLEQEGVDKKLMEQTIARYRTRAQRISEVNNPTLLIEKRSLAPCATL